MKSKDLSPETTRCPKQWTDMVGDSERRYCEDCKLHVHNLSEMTEESREQLMSSSGRVCGTYYLDHDGTLLSFNDLPKYRSVLARLRIKFAELALSLLVSFLTVLRRLRGIQASSEHGANALSAKKKSEKSQDQEARKNLRESA